jgi:serine/threonine protein kinase
MSGEARCQQCGASVAEGSLFCPKCGVEVTGVHGADAATLEVTSLGGPAPRIQSTMRQILRDATLGEYEILTELGRGGMATVFLAHDISLDRKVAIKVMAPHLLEGEGMAERFKLEARTAAQLSHPHIIPIYAVKETESTLFFVMKFVEGRPLDDIIKKMGQLPIPMVKDILTKVGSALGYAHRRGVVHRDVKPGNVMIDEEGTPIVTDFGIAKVAETKGLTMTGTTIGTPAYMSPEQCEAKEVTGASDQYSLGIVAWEMLTGQTPFAGDSAVSTMYKHCHEPLPPLEDFRPDCPAEVRETVARMLAKAPAERWPSLEAAIRKLGATTQDQLDPIRRELLELAREADPREILAQLSTPRSPLPGVRTAQRTPAGAMTPTPAQPARRSWFPLAAAGFVAVAATTGALAVLQPWQSGVVPAGPEGGGGPGVEAGAPAGVNGGQADGSSGAGPAGGSSSASNGGGVGGQAFSGGGGQTEGGQPAGGGGGAGGAPPPVAGTSGGSNTGGGTTRPPAQPAVATVASVRIDGARSGLEPGDQLTLSASAFGAGGTSMRGGAPRWSSGDSSVGTVSQDGVFTAVAPGSTTVTATIDGMPGSTILSVSPASVSSLVVQPASVTLTAGERTTLVAEPRARSGDAVQAGVTWISSAPAVASVTSGGEVEAVGPGTARITASAGGASQTVAVTVTAPAVDARTAIEELIAAYARALESGDINAVRRTYPGMTPEQEQQLRQSLPAIDRANLRVTSLQEQRDAATASVEGTYQFLINGRRSTSEPFTFRATFELVDGVWRMIRTQ